MVTLIIILMVVVMTGQFIRGDQIQCFTPVYFTGAQVEYSHSTCWALGTQYIIGVSWSLDLIMLNKRSSDHDIIGVS